MKSLKENRISDNSLDNFQYQRLDNTESSDVPPRAENKKLTCRRLCCYTCLIVASILFIICLYLILVILFEVYGAYKAYKTADSLYINISSQNPDWVKAATDSIGIYTLIN